MDWEPLINNTIKEIKKNLTFDYIVKAAILFFAYYFTGRIGLSIDPVSDFATLFWMPTGISLTFLFLYGRKFWPAIFLGAFYVNLVTGAPPIVSFSIAIGNSLEALAGVFFLKKMRFQPSFERVADSLNLIFYAGFLSTLISAIIGTISLSQAGLLTSSFTSTFTVWWLGDMLSNFVVAPLIFTWGQNPKVIVTQSKIFEAVIISLFTIILGIFIFTAALGIFFKNAPFSFLVFPPLLWIALRFKPRETATATFVLSIIAAWATFHGFGPFAVDDRARNLIFLQIFMATASVTFLVFASSTAEKKNLENIKDEFIDVAAHELKTPLTSIKAYSQMIYKNLFAKEDFKNAEFAAKMDNQLGKLSRLVNDLLDISKIEQKRLRIEQSYFDFNELVFEIVDQVRSTTERDIETNLDRTKTIYADRDRIGQVISNLLLNAVKFSPLKTSVKVTTSAERRKIILCVKDFGIGIPRADMLLIFDRMYRGKGNETYPGLGLGLYISKEIINRHRGAIWAKSKKGNGSTFCFSLPLSQFLL